MKCDHQNIRKVSPWRVYQLIVTALATTSTAAACMNNTCRPHPYTGHQASNSQASSRRRFVKFVKLFKAINISQFAISSVAFFSLFLNNKGQPSQRA